MKILVDTDEIDAMLREAYETGWDNGAVGTRYRVRDPEAYAAEVVRRLLAKQPAPRGDVCSACDAQIHSYCIDPNCECRKRGDKPHRILTQVAKLSTVALPKEQP
jgi:hypothetical protein